MTKLISSKKLITFLKFATLLFAMSSSTSLFIQAQSNDTVVAIVNNKKITQQEIDDSVASQIFPLEQQIYAIRKAALENYILRVLLDAEAKKRGISVDELKKQLTKGEIKIPTEQIEQKYTENAASFGQMSPDEAKERIRLDMEMQERIRNYRAAVLKLKENAQIDIRLREPVLPSVTITNNTPSIGDRNAKVTIIEFSDFQCPYCKEAQSAIKQMLQSYKNEVRFVFKHLPLGAYSQVFPAAQAAFCAGEQGKFWEYHDFLFASKDLSSEALDRFAVGLNLDMSKFKTCLNAESSRAAILKDVQEANRLGIDGTPTFIINGKRFRGVLSFEDFKKIIESELKSAQTQKN